MRSNAAPRGTLDDFTNSNFYSLLRPSTERAIDAARRLLYLAELPSKVACGALSKATSLGERIQGGLRSLFSRRDTPLDDDISSTAPNPKQALPSPTPAPHSPPPLQTPQTSRNGEPLKHGARFGHYIGS